VVRAPSCWSGQRPVSPMMNRGLLSAAKEALIRSFATVLANRSAAETSKTGTAAAGSDSNRELVQVAK
jgi:hypothetical protein